MLIPKSLQQKFFGKRIPEGYVPEDYRLSCLISYTNGPAIETHEFSEEVREDEYEGKLKEFQNLLVDIKKKLRRKNGMLSVKNFILIKKSDFVSARVGIKKL